MQEDFMLTQIRTYHIDIRVEVFISF